MHPLAQKRIDEANARCLRSLGFSEEEIEARRIAEPARLKRVLAEERKAMRG